MMDSPSTARHIIELARPVRRVARALVIAAAWACGNAQAISVDAKALARFDLGYGECEALIPQMRGHRDEAWLSLWRTRADDTSRAQLASARKSAAYAAERKRVLGARAAGHAPAASSPLNQQCQALWAETQRGAKTPS